MTIADLDAKARAVGLTVRGAFHPIAEDAAPEGCRTVVMLGPDEPDFWATFTASPEYLDGQPDPLDRWSRRVVSALSAPLGATALFPYDGPPYPPFLRWALRSGTSWSSPVQLLVHETAGLFISFRAALAIFDQLEIPTTGSKPCLNCGSRPCAAACPVGALAPDQSYGVSACKAHVESAEGAECRSGCLVRRACPVSQSFARLPEQSAFHMRAFLKNSL